MLTVHHLYKTYNIQPILEDVSFSVSNNERVGLIGPNGSGKTTLMRILAGFEQPDSGTVVSTRPNLRTAYLAQGMESDDEQTLQSALRHSLRSQDGALGLAAVSEADSAAEIASLASALASNPNDLRLQAKYDAALRQLSALSHQPSAVLGPLGLSDMPLDTPVKHLSGGQKTRLMLARVLLE